MRNLFSPSIQDTKAEFNLPLPGHHVDKLSPVSYRSHGCLKISVDRTVKFQSQPRYPALQALGLLLLEVLIGSSWCFPLVYNKLVDSVESALLLATQTPTVLYCSPPSYARGIYPWNECKLSSCDILTHRFSINENSCWPPLRWNPDLP